MEIGAIARKNFEYDYSNFCTIYLQLNGIFELFE